MLLSSKVVIVSTTFPELLKAPHDADLRYPTEIAHGLRPEDFDQSLLFRDRVPSSLMIGLHHASRSRTFAISVLSGLPGCC